MQGVHERQARSVSTARNLGQGNHGSGSVWRIWRLRGGREEERWRRIQRSVSIGAARNRGRGGLFVDRVTRWARGGRCGGRPGSHRTSWQVLGARARGDRLRPWAPAALATPTKRNLARHRRCHTAIDKGIVAAAARQTKHQRRLLGKMRDIRFVIARRIPSWVCHGFDTRRLRDAHHSRQPRVRSYSLETTQCTSAAREERLAHRFLYEEFPTK